LIKLEFTALDVHPVADKTQLKL